MVQKKRDALPPAESEVVAPKRRGRPRAYEPEIALGKALELFRKDGFAATSLDDLSAATGMNRPSLYGAFGDKRDLYIKSYLRHRDEARAKLVEIVRAQQPIREQLRRIFDAALDMYLSGDEGPRGCFTVMTVASEAVFDPDIRGLVLEGFAELDKAFLNCFQRARDNGELSASSSPEALAQMASATLHLIAIRARAQVPRKQLEATVKGAIDVMVGK
jgi:TetR/AcrR family transcriptional regulator, copper-responsive repressor